MTNYVYSSYHFVFLAILLVLIVASAILGKKYLNEKGKLIFMRVMGVLVLVCALLSRYHMAKYANRYIYLVSNSYCGLTGYLFGVALLVAKPNGNIFHCLWYMAFIGGLVTMIYPDFLLSVPYSFFHPKALFCMLYHAFMFMECIIMLVFKQFKFDLKKIYILPIGILCYIGLGYFEYYVLNEGADSMCVKAPMLSGTSINCWFILGVGTALAALVNTIIYFINKKKLTK